MISSLELSKLLVCTVLLAGGCSRSNEKNEELAQARAELEVARGEAAEARAEADAAQAALPKPRQPAGITFAIHSYEGANEAGYGPLIAEFERRGFLRRPPPACRRFARLRNCRWSSMSMSAAKRTTRYGRSGSSGPRASICMSNRSSSEARATAISWLSTRKRSWTPRRRDSDEYE